MSNRKAPRRFTPDELNFLKENSGKPRVSSMRFSSSDLDVRTSPPKR